MLKGDWSLVKNRTHIKSKICWIQICASSQIVKICCNREKSEGDFWETVPNPFFLKLLKVSLLMRNSAEHVSVASSSPTSTKCHCFLLSCSFPGIFQSVNFYFLIFWKNIYLKSTTGAIHLSSNSCSFAELRIATFFEGCLLICCA